MIKAYVLQIVGERIAGSIVWNENPSESMKKWRDFFRVSQQDLAKVMGISSSVIVDYERGRRAPGVKFLRKYVQALLDVDRSRGFPVTKELVKSLGLNLDYILDMGDFYEGLPVDVFITAVGGVPASSILPSEKISGYVIVDSIRSITMLSGSEFYQLLSFAVGRAMIFTHVSSGRSPMIALKVAPIKPKIVVLHSPIRIDPLALMLAESENLPVLVSTLKSEKDLLERLKLVKAKNSLSTVLQ